MTFVSIDIPRIEKGYKLYNFTIKQRRVKL